MRPRWMTLAALTTTFVLALSACGQSPVRTMPGSGGVAETAPPQADPVEGWAAGYCGAVAHLVQALASLPVVDPTSPQRASETSSNLLASLVGGLDQSLAGLNALGPPPFAAAEQGRRTVAGRFGDIRRQAEYVRHHIDAVRGDPVATKAALGDARATLDRVADLNLLEGLQGSPRLADAGQRIPGCQALARPHR